MKEIWKQIPIKGLEQYQVSNYGNIKNSHSNKILKPQKNQYGYMSIVLYKNSVPCSFRVHRLVLSAFAPVDNMENLQVNHIDTNRSNNFLCNLEWVTSSENCKKKKKKDIFYNSKGCFDNLGNYFHSYREAARFHNISANTVKRDCLGLTNYIENYKGRKDRPLFKSV